MKVEYIDHMGNDDSVVNAARVSFAKTASLFSDVENESLIRYLAKHNHWTPFSHTAITLRMQAPISIRTQCYKHKVGFSENEESRRYISTAPEYYLPTFRHKPDRSIKQGSGEAIEEITGTYSSGDPATYTQEFLQNEYSNLLDHAIRTYEAFISLGVAPEQARFILPQGVETQWVWTGNLQSFARFYSLRTDPHAQKEIQELAKMVGGIIQPLYPVSWKYLTKQP